MQRLLGEATIGIAIVWLITQVEAGDTTSPSYFRCFFERLKEARRSAVKPNPISLRTLCEQRFLFWISHIKLGSRFHKLRQYRLTPSTGCQCRTEHWASGKGYEMTKKRSYASGELDQVQRKLPGKPSLNDAGTVSGTNAGKKMAANKETLEGHSSTIVEHGTSAVENDLDSPIWNDEFCLLTWNIDGLDDRFLKLRTEAVADLIKSVKPGVVFLQEVVPASLELLRKRLESAYLFVTPRYHPGVSLPYFCTMLLCYNQLLPYEGSEETYWFPGTVMGRHLLSINARPLNRPDECIAFSTAHLESTRQFAEERKKQFRQAMDRLQTKMDSDLKDSPTVAIFGGDMNIGNSELKDEALPIGMKDIWQFLGSPKSCAHTWDLLKNTNIESRTKWKARIRFDRLYWFEKRRDEIERQSDESKRWTPKVMKLVGTSKLDACEMFASDHFGLLVKFLRV